VRKTYYIKVRAEYSAFIPIEADSELNARILAEQKLFDGMNDEYQPSVDIEEYDPNDFT
tara:strand:- start:599 stop:775 length:177 start_codon:yes stop_codon:yes gene_type:complete